MQLTSAEIGRTQAIAQGQPIINIIRSDQTVDEKALRNQLPSINSESIGLFQQGVQATSTAEGGAQVLRN